MTNTWKQHMQHLQQQLEDTCKAISYHQQQITNCDDKIKLIQRQIFDVCEHKWVRDTADRGEHTTWVCEVCCLDRAFR